MPTCLRLLLRRISSIRFNIYKEENVLISKEEKVLIGKKEKETISGTWEESAVADSAEPKQ